MRLDKEPGFDTRIEGQQIQAAFQNNIPVIQNQASHLKLLGAQRALYWRAKRWMGIQLIATAVIALGFTAFGERFTALRPWGAFAGLALLFMDTWGFEFWQRGLREHAAKIQEEFDCKVLHLAWNEFWIGEHPDEEEVIEFAAKYEEIDPEYKELLDWYSFKVGRIPLPLARIICQRSNIRWDFRLRRAYGGGALALTLIALCTLTAVGLIGQFSLGDTLLSLTSLSPLLVLCGREFVRQKHAADNLQRLMGHVKGLWEQVRKGELTGEELETKSRALQDAIFDHRRNSPVLFDWVYRLYRSGAEAEMSQTAEKMIEEVSSSEDEKADSEGKGKS